MYTTQLWSYLSPDMLWILKVHLSNVHKAFWRLDTGVPEEGHSPVDHKRWNTSRPSGLDWTFTVFWRLGPDRGQETGCCCQTLRFSYCTCNRCICCDYCKFGRLFIFVTGRQSDRHFKPALNKWQEAAVNKQNKWYTLQAQLHTLSSVLKVINEADIRPWEHAV